MYVRFSLGSTVVITSPALWCLASSVKVRFEAPKKCNHDEEAVVSRGKDDSPGYASSID